MTLLAALRKMGLRLISNHVFVGYNHGYN